jgi:hypothetical protein
MAHTEVDQPMSQGGRRATPSQIITNKNEAAAPPTIAIITKFYGGVVNRLTYPTASWLTRLRGSLSPSSHQNFYSTTMSQQQHHLAASKEAQIQTALRALQQDATLSQRRAAAIYSVPQRTISHRRAGGTSCEGPWLGTESRVPKALRWLSGSE